MTGIFVLDVLLLFFIVIIFSIAIAGGRRPVSLKPGVEIDRFFACYVVNKAVRFFDRTW
jgi:hypothetical protein